MPDDIQVFNRQDAEVIKKEILYQGFCQVERYTIRNRLFSGGWSQPYLREIVSRHNVAGVIPYDPKLDYIVLIEQFRAGAMLHEGSPWLLEIVAGVMDRGNSESYETLAKREVKEEAGLEVLDLMLIYDYLPSPGGSSNFFRLFCAKVDATKAPKFCGLAEEQEDIKIHVVPSATAFAWVRSGKIRNAPAIIALQWLELNLKNVRRWWE